MRKFSILLVLIAVLGCGCAQRSVSEDEFNQVWREYLQKEFEEGFDEMQSIAQREKALREICADSRIDYEALKRYMMKKHEAKYSRIFLGK